MTSTVIPNSASKNTVPNGSSSNGSKLWATKPKSVPAPGSSPTCIPIEPPMGRLRFAQIWTRPGLTIKERRLISLSVAATAGSRLGFSSHLRGALDSGDLSEEELWEWLIHFTQYAGYPKAAPVWSEYRLILAERGSMPLPSHGVDPARLEGAQSAEQPEP